ncbi:Six-hairpin glycosidase [Dichomitus squalens]|uniref:Endoglucanase n=1 Tax=Dichomitus squalens TaxID=114155 RepID=A0A4Q9Q975_9APHY|nr:Six-hairpin glycosidase [Dichomitus squalens]TBU64142.1 Six-hairpin glycosidase [Dichomitus squalens]
MWLASVLSLCLLTLPLVHAQLPLPSQPWLPPNASVGTQSSNGTSPNQQWSNVVGNLLYFYEEQRSGKLPQNKRVLWRNDSALDDGKDAGLDLTGGYYDAGDYVKFTFPMSFSMMSICFGALASGRGYDLANQTAYLDDALRWGLDWLMKAHPSPNTYYVEVGDPNVDNNYWGGDQGIPTPRPSFQINSTSPGTDAAAQGAAAFAACSALYNNRTLSASSSTSTLQNATYAALLQGHARDLYAFATNSPMQLYQKAVPAAGDGYASSDYKDELAIAAMFLALSETGSNASTYYNDAIKWYYSGNLAFSLQAGEEAVFNWDSKTPAVPLLGAAIANAYPNVVSGSNVTLNLWQSAVEQYFNVFINKNGRSYLTNGGLLYFPGDSDEASLNPALNTAMLMMIYAATGISSSQMDEYRAYAQGQIDYVMGKNPMNVPYVVGVHPDSPVNPHSAISTGWVSPDPSVLAPSDFANDPPQEAYILYGGVVGGPSPKDLFYDLRSDWVENEVALDYNAPLLTLAANALVVGSGDPWYTQVQPGSYAAVKPSGSPCDAAVSTGCKHGPGHLSTGAKIAIGVVVSVVGLAIIALAGYWWWTSKTHGRGRRY